jgi:very-short-patch-repair endonuclease
MTDDIAGAAADDIAGAAADDIAGAAEHTPAPGPGRVVRRHHGGNGLTHRVKVLGVSQEVLVTGPLTLRIAQIARRQRGYVARRQLLAAGVGSSTIGWLRGHHRLFLARRCVYTVGHDAPGALGEETSALLALRDGAVLSHGSAAAIWGLAPRPALIEVVLAGGPGASLDGVVVHRSRSLTTKDITVRQRLPVTSVARTLLDQADSLTERQLELAVDRAIVDRILHPSQMDELLQRTTGRRGVPLLRELVQPQRAPTISRSEAEERMLQLIRAAQLPAPRMNVRVLGYEVDFYWPEQRFVLEVDGYRFHSGHRAFEHDRRKDSALVSVGIAAMRVTWRQLEREPYAVIARLAQGLGQAGRKAA